MTSGWLCYVVLIYGSVCKGKVTAALFLLSHRSIGFDVAGCFAAAFVPYFFGLAPAERCYLAVKVFFLLILNSWSNFLSTLSELASVCLTKRVASTFWVVLSPEDASSSEDAELGIMPPCIVSWLILVARWAYRPPSKPRIAIVWSRCFYMNLPRSISFSIIEAALSSFLRWSRLFLVLKQMK